MTPNETSTLSSDTLLMIQGFREANPDKRDRPLSAAEFLRKNAHRIRGIGPLLEMAGLAEQDDQSALGWRPTQHLIGLIANRAGRWTSYPDWVLRLRNGGDYWRGKSTTPTLMRKNGKPYQCSPQVRGMPVLDMDSISPSRKTRK
jgi:hypothetical protein